MFTVTAKSSVHLGQVQAVQQCPDAIWIASRRQYVELVVHENDA
jgi:hypothetical protein